MIFRQVFDNKSSTYTYLIASAKGREAVIIDPVIENVESYISILNELELKLVKVIDTHIHADHVTGASKLKQSTNCSTIMGEHTPADTVDIKLKDDDIIKIDQLEIKAMYTPGQNGLSQAKEFTNSVSCDSVFLSKLDGSAKGGIVLPISSELQLPISFIGTGEKESDLEIFDAEEYANALIDAEDI